MSYEEALACLRFDVGGCREWIGNDRCGAPAEFVLWGMLFPAEGLGPRCYDHAAKHAGHSALGDPSYAIIDLARLARRLSLHEVAA